MGTTITPARTQPQNAATHSGRFSDQKTTLSPFRILFSDSRAANRRAAKPTCAYVYFQLRYPLSYWRNSVGKRENSQNKSTRFCRGGTDGIRFLLNMVVLKVELASGDCNQVKDRQLTSLIPQGRNPTL